MQEKLFAQAAPTQHLCDPDRKRLVLNHLDGCTGDDMLGEFEQQSAVSEPLDQRERMNS